MISSYLSKKHIFHTSLEEQQVKWHICEWLFEIFQPRRRVHLTWAPQIEGTKACVLNVPLRAFLGELGGGVGVAGSCHKPCFLFLSYDTNHFNYISDLWLRIMINFPKCKHYIASFCNFAGIIQFVSKSPTILKLQSFTISVNSFLSLNRFFFLNLFSSKGRSLFLMLKWGAQQVCKRGDLGPKKEIRFITWLDENHTFM